MRIKIYLKKKKKKKVRTEVTYAVDQTLKIQELTKTHTLTPHPLRPHGPRALKTVAIDHKLIDMTLGRSAGAFVCMMTAERAVVWEQTVQSMST